MHDQDTKAKAIRLVREHAGDYPSEDAAITAVARRLKMSAETLRSWLRRAADDEAEEQVAEYVKEAVAQYDGRNLGTRTRRDDRDSSDLRVDFTYDDAIPPAAMEITALVEDHVRALGAELLKLETQLQEVVSSEELGAWMLGIRVGANVRNLRQPLKDLLRRQWDRNGGAIFAADEAPEGMTDGDLRLPAELFDLGLAAAGRSDEENKLSIFPPVSDAQEGDGDIGTLLEEAMRDNVDKLCEARSQISGRPRETHLVVTLDRSDLSPDPVRTPVPELRDGIDVLWVLLGYFNAKTTYRLWRTTASDRRWHLLRHPLGKPPAVYPPHAAS